MELLHKCSFIKGSNHFLNNFLSVRVYGFTSYRVNRICYSSSCWLFGGVKVFTDLKNDNPQMLSNRTISKNGLFDRWKTFSSMFKRGSERTSLALYVYRTLEDIDFKELYAFLESPDTFNSWFAIMELHMWMLLSHMMDKDKEGVKVRNEIIELFWYDVEARIDKLNLKTPKIIKKQLSELNDRFPITLLVYDEGILSDDYVLAGALWYKFFEKHYVDPRKLEVLVRYIRYQMVHLSSLNLKDYTEAQKISKIWIPFEPHVSHVMSRN